jgi:hypothetical protein
LKEQQNKETFAPGVCRLALLLSFMSSVSADEEMKEGGKRGDRLQRSIAPPSLSVSPRKKGKESERMKEDETNKTTMV